MARTFGVTVNINIYDSRSLDAASKAETVVSVNPVASASAELPITAPAPAAAASVCANDELVAVITSAIAATCGASARVTGIKPVVQPAASGWRRLGRIQNMEGL